MKIAAGILLLLTAHLAAAQNKYVDFNGIDNRVRFIEPAPPAQLALSLTAPYFTEMEKLRAIFSWITEHISYRTKGIFRNRKNSRIATDFPETIDTARWKTANDIVAETVLKNQSAFCDGYARLFKTLCDYAGLRSEVIIGYARAEYGPRAIKFHSNHTWNAVYVDSAWHLLDVTWASGYMSHNGAEFFKHKDNYYFLTPPEEFILDHFPDNIGWTLLEHVPTMRELERDPFKPRAFSKYHLTSYQPEKGVIEVAEGDTIQITLDTNDPQMDKKIAADTTVSFDSTMQTIFSSVVYLAPVADLSGKKMNYQYTVDQGNVEWLQIMYNNDVVLSYKLKIKKGKNTLTDAVVK